MTDNPQSHDHETRPPASPTRQTTAYLKQLFVEVGFVIDAKRGQNFLVDLNLLDLLERSAGITPADVVLEVGTGTGALSERLSRAAKHVVTCEVDSRLACLARDKLIDCDNVTLVEGDVLAGKHRFAPAVLAAIEAAIAASPGARLLLVANLPYCVATPVISNLLALPCPFDTAVVTVQREMGERMTAAAGSHSYNALSVWIGAQCRSELVRVLPPSVFWPRPKVESAIVRLDLEPARRAAIAHANPDPVGFRAMSHCMLAATGADAYLPIAIVFVMAAIFAVVNLVASQLLGPRASGATKGIAYESGMDPFGSARKKFNIRFYVLAMTFLVFDVEIIFLYPWAVTFSQLEPRSPEAALFLGRILFFIGTSVVAYIYAWRKGVFRWD